MLKKITTDTHTFLVEEENARGHEDAIYGKALLLSIYVGFNKKQNSKSGSYYFNNDSKRIALKKNVILEENPTEKEIEFYNLLIEKKEVGYSTSLVEKYEIKDYIRCYFVENKSETDKKEEDIVYPSCKVYYSHKVLKI